VYIVTCSYRFFCSCILSVSGCVACSSLTMLAVNTPSSLFSSRMTSLTSCISRSLFGMRSLHSFSDLDRFDIVSCLSAADCFNLFTSTSRTSANFLKSAIVLEYLSITKIFRQIVSHFSMTRHQNQARHYNLFYYVKANQVRTSKVIYQFFLKIRFG